MESPELSAADRVLSELLAVLPENSSGTANASGRAQFAVIPGKGTLERFAEQPAAAGAFCR